MGQRLIISENEKNQISKMYGLVNEQSSNIEQVDVTHIKNGNGYHIMQDGNKFYIYISNSSTQNKPKLFDGDVYNGGGKGYSSKEEAKKVLDWVMNNPDKLPK